MSLWVLTALSLLGVVLNIRKDRRGFALWMVTNASWAYIDFKSGLIEQAVLFAVYFLLAVWGWFNWGGSNGNRKLAQKV